MRSDSARFLRYSGTLECYSRKSASQASLTMHYHVVEKALSFANPRPGFGREDVSRLVSELEGYLSRFGPDELAKVVLNVLFAYYNFNLQHGLDDRELLGRLMSFEEQMPDNLSGVQAGGVLPASREEIQRAGRSAFEVFVRQRYSIRNFADKPVPMELIREAVRISLKSPSACNRQPWRVHCYSQRRECNRILKYQGGNRGFGDSAGAVLIITCDLSAFFGVLERHAAYVDGGTFAMSLVYAIHSLGLGTCCLNLSLQPENESALRRAAGIGENEVFIMMIVVGELPETLLVAQSSRKSLDDILVAHGRADDAARNAEQQGEAEEWRCGSA